ncbi:MAG TPA: hypothetical protein VGR43_10800 [Dehalococcoidia bacterium]|jgi:hypothetical protein|nr:hypothetical protein [Dehalococcoidia bacterium]
MNPYLCAECDWQYVWTMGDRVKAVMRHELAHLLEGRGGVERSDLVAAALRLISQRVDPPAETRRFL